MGLVLTLQVVILGVLEGLTEFLPVSSTAHLLIAGRILSLPTGNFLEVFSVAIQSGAILAAVVYFWNDIWSERTLWWKIGIAFIPTAIAGILLYPLIKPLFSSHQTMALALIVGGILLVVLKPKETERSVQSITTKEAFFLGIMQIASFIPGVSRAGATLIGGTFARIPRSIIVPFSFLLAIPTIIGAGVVEIRNTTPEGASAWILIVLGGLVAFFTALISIRFFITLLTKKPLAWIGWYRIALGVIVLLLL